MELFRGTQPRAKKAEGEKGTLLRPSRLRADERDSVLPLVFRMRIWKCFERIGFIPGDETTETFAEWD